MQKYEGEYRPTLADVRAWVSRKGPHKHQYRSLIYASHPAQSHPLVSDRNLEQRGLWNMKGSREIFVSLCHISTRSMAPTHRTSHVLRGIKQ